MKSLVGIFKNGAKRAGIGLAAIGLIAGYGATKADAIPILTSSVDWTSFTQLYDWKSTPAELVGNNGDLSVNGVLANNIKVGAGLLKDGRIIGDWDNGSDYGMGEWFAGSVNVDPYTNVPANDPGALVVNERNNGTIVAVDVNGDGKWGRVDTYDNGNVYVFPQSGELVLNSQGIIVDGVRGDFSSFPRYLGSVDGMENAGRFPSIDVDTSYAETIPEPTSLLLLGIGLLGAGGLAERKRRSVKERDLLIKNLS